jgi:hypothetical protein
MRRFIQVIVLVIGLCVLAGLADDGADVPTTRPQVKVPKPPMITPEQWGSRPRPIPDSRKQVPRLITIHHAGTFWKPGTDPAAMVRAVQAYGQKEKGWPDLPYHFMIAPDGRIFQARPLQYEPESNTKYPLNGHVGVELMGNFQEQRPSLAQLKSTVALVAWLCQDLHIDPSQIAGHKDRAKGQTVCPGKDLYRYLADGEFVGWVKQTLAGKTPDIKPGPPLPGGPTHVIDTPTTQPDH